MINVSLCPLYVIGIYLVKIILLLIVQGNRPLLLVGWKNKQIIRQHFWSLTNPTLLGISRHQKQVDQVFLLGKQTQRVISYNCKKSDTQNLPAFFLFNRKEIYLFFKIGGALHNFKPVPSLGVDMSIFVKFFEISETSFSTISSSPKCSKLSQLFLSLCQKKDDIWWESAGIFTQSESLI